VDLLGIVPTDAYIMVIPRADTLPAEVTSEDALYALTALCGSAFASAWIDERRSTRNIPPELFRDLPLPDGWAELAKYGRQLVSAAGNREQLAPIVAALDPAVNALYGLDDVETVAIQARYAGITAPEGVTRFPEPPSTSAPTPSDRAMLTYGAVLDMTATDVRLWAPGITSDDGEILPLPPRFPGSLLYSGADFSVRADSGDLRHGEFRLHASAWRSPLLSTVHEPDVDESDTDDSSDGFYDNDYLSDNEHRIR